MSESSLIDDLMSAVDDATSEADKLLQDGDATEDQKMFDISSVDTAESPMEVIENAGMGGTNTVVVPPETASPATGTLSFLDEIESLDANQMLPFLHAKHDAGILADIAVGGAIRRIMDNEWEEIYGYESTKDLLEVEFGMRYRKGMYLVNIYDKVVEFGITEKYASKVSWTKFRELLPILSRDNYKSWLTKAKKMTILQIRSAVEKALQSDNDEDVPETEADNTYSNLSLQLFADQKESIQDAIDMAKTELGTDSTASALAGICVGYMSNDAGKKPSLKDVMKASTPLEVLEIFSELWPEIDVRVDTKESGEGSNGADSDGESSAD